MKKNVLFSSSLLICSSIALAHSRVDASSLDSYADPVATQTLSDQLDSDQEPFGPLEWTRRGATAGVSDLLYKADIKVDRVGWFSPELRVRMNWLLTIPNSPEGKVISIQPLPGGYWDDNDHAPLNDKGKSFKDFEIKFVKKLADGRELWSAKKEAQFPDVWAGRSNYPVQKFLIQVLSSDKSQVLYRSKHTLILRETGVFMTPMVWENGRSWKEGGSELCIAAIGRAWRSEANLEIVYRLEDDLSEVQTLKADLIDPNGLYNGHPEGNPKGKLVNDEANKFDLLAIYEGCVPVPAETCVQYALRYQRDPESKVYWDNNFGEIYRQCSR